MKQLIVCMLALSCCNGANAQKVKNYNSQGKATESKTDFLTITFEHHDDKPVAGNVAAIPGIITAIIGPILKVGVDAWATHIEKKQKSFAATYSNQVVMSIKTTDYITLQKPGNLYLHLRRYGVNSINDKLEKTNLYSEFIFEVTQFDEDRVELRLISVYLAKSKARYNKPEEDLAVGIDIKLTPSITDTAPAEDAPQTTDGKDATTDKKSNGGKKAADGGAKKDAKVETDGSGGESIVKIPLIKVNDAATSIDKSVVLINHGIFNGLPKPGDKPLNLTIAVTITEANADHLEPSLIEKLIQSNGSDFTDIIKGLLSGGSSSKSKSD
jgi:hypothetical protein